jgi:hypothetical protein
MELSSIATKNSMFRFLNSRRSAAPSPSADRIDVFAQLCERERCPFAVVGEATQMCMRQIAHSPSNRPLNNN